MTFNKTIPPHPRWGYRFFLLLPVLVLSLLAQAGDNQRRESCQGGRGRP